MALNEAGDSPLTVLRHKEETVHLIFLTGIHCLQVKCNNYLPQGHLGMAFDLLVNQFTERSVHVGFEIRVRHTLDHVNVDCYLLPLLLYTSADCLF